MDWKRPSSTNGRPSDRAERPSSLSDSAIGDSYGRHTEPRRLDTARKRATVKQPPSADPARRVAEMPTTQRRGRIAWLALLACMAVAIPALVVDIQTPAVIDEGEALSLATTLDTWRHQTQLREAGVPLWSFDMWVPHRNGEARLDLPPGATLVYTPVLWTLNATTGRSPYIDAIRTSEMVLRTRLVSAAAVVVTVAAVFWIGYSLGGLPTASIAALFFAAAPLVVFHGRLASGAPLHMMWSTLAIGAAMWAMRPLRPAASVVRQALGWIISGTALGLALLTGGTIAVPLLLLPLAVMVIICSHRVSHMLGLVAAAVLATLMALPWIAFAYQHDTTVWQRWVAEMTPALLFNPNLLGPSVGWRAVLILLAVMPWTGWLIAGLMQPFSTSSSGSRARLFLGWSWFVAVTLLMIVSPDTSRLGRMLVVVPAACVMMGQLFGQFIELSAEGRHARLWRGMRWVYLSAAAATAVLLPAAFALQSTLIEHDWLTARFSAGMSWAFWVGLSAVLLGGVVLTFRWAVQHYPGLTAVGWAMWMIVLMGTLAIPLARGPLADSLVREDAKTLVALVGERPVYWLTDIGGRLGEPNPALLLHLPRRLPTITVRDIDDAMTNYGRLYVLAPDTSPAGAADDAVPAPPLPLANQAPGTGPGATVAFIRRLPAVNRVIWRYTAPADSHVP